MWSLCWTVRIYVISRISLVFTVPIELIKCLQQVDIGKANSLKQIVRKINETHGVLGFYRGFWATFNRDFLSFGVYFSTYYMIKDYYIDNGKKFSSYQQLLAGGLAGIVIIQMN